MSLGFGLMGIGSLLVLAIIIIPISLLVYHFSSTSAANTTQQTSTHALDILNERYARGEITHEEYILKKETLLKR